ncbi:MAG: UTP--glucose-1-phosphate uridylyltransferase GalU [Dongiaceae bacterium]
MSKAVKRAIFPVGGLGVRFLPATKAVPKEMLPVVDKPLIQYAVEEARAAGIEQFIFVTARGKAAIEDLFDRSAELDTMLRARGKAREIELVDRLLPQPGEMSFVRQQQPLGLGHAVWCARHLVGDEPVAVILPDDLIMSRTPCLKQMVEAQARCGGSLLAVMDVPREHTARYGVLDVAHEDGSLAAVRGLVEKPAPAQAPSTLSVIGRYILAPEIFAALGEVRPGAGGEIQLTDAIAALIGRSPVHGFRFEGTRFDCGDKLGFLEANLAFALRHRELAQGAARLVSDYAGRLAASDPDLAA